MNLLAPPAVVLSGHFATLAPWLIWIDRGGAARAGAERAGGAARPARLRLGREGALRGAAAAPIRRILAAPRPAA